VAITFYLTLDCENCNKEIRWGPVMAFDEHQGLPAIPYDVAAQTRFDCEDCGAANYTGDFELYAEGGRDPEDDEDDGDDGPEDE
jgi:hypothetical protein